jgi:hypothetical protein
MRLRTPILLLAGILVIVGFFVFKRDLDRTADASAHSALAAEIHRELASVPEGQPYPDSLADLKLTYPDGGDSHLLKLFEYRSDGTSCIVRTTLRFGDISWTFPPAAKLEYIWPRAAQ